jgi:tRNA modification GTPase
MLRCNEMLIWPLRIIHLTPPGRGAIATVRLEGPGALDAVAADFRTPNGRPLADFAPGRLIFGRFGTPPGEEVVVRRYSDEAIELHCHGGRAAAAMIEQVLIAAGARVMSWRDWAATREAEAIAVAARIALADARTERTAAILLDQYQGALRRALGEIEAKLHQGDPAGARRLTEMLLARAPLGRHLTQPWQVVIAGSPNVGKSSLINALAGYQRAIVHPAPGTTRDLVTVQTALDGWPVELCDTAGLHAGGDPVERAGIELARRRLAAADLVVLVFDRSRPWSDTDQEMLVAWPSALVVYNKSDLPAADDGRPTGLSVSALGQQGTEGLAAAISARLVPDPPPPGAAVPFTREQVEALQRVP